MSLTKYMLPTLISLTLSSPLVLAQKTGDADKPADPPASRETSATDKHQEIMKRHQAHMEYMREQMKKLREADDPEEYYRLMEEMQKNREAMRKKMWEEVVMPGRDWERPDFGRGGPGWDGPGRGGPGWDGPGWGGPGWGGPGWGGPGWDGPGWGRGPNWGGPGWDAPDMPYGPSYYDRPFKDKSDRKTPKRCPNKKLGGKHKKHQQEMEQSLKKIEQILEKMLDLMKEDKDE